MGTSLMSTYVLATKVSPHPRYGPGAVGSETSPMDPPQLSFNEPPNPRGSGQTFPHIPGWNSGFSRKPSQVCPYIICSEHPRLHPTCPGARLGPGPALWCPAHRKASWACAVSLSVCTPSFPLHPRTASTSSSTGGILLPFRGPSFSFRPGTIFKGRIRSC